MSFKSINFNKLYTDLIHDEKTKVSVWTLVIGIVIHMFGMVNILHNHDNISSYLEGYGNGVTSGRWALSLFGGATYRLWGVYNLPFINGILLMIILAIAVWLLLDLFKIKSFKLGLLIGGCIVAFPSITTLMFYRFTVVFYGIAILLSIFAVWILEKYKYGFVFSVLSIAFSLGIYQAYIPFTISIMVIVLIKDVIENDKKISDIFKKGLYYSANLIIGLVVYYILMVLSLKVYNESLLSYQGISDMGKVSLEMIISGINNAYISFIRMPFYDYCKLAPNNILKISYQILFILCIIMLIYKIAKMKNIGGKIMAIILTFIFPLAVNFIEVMCPNSWVYTLMVMSGVTLLFVPVLLYIYLDDKNRLLNIIKKAAILVTSVIVINYAYLANVNYHIMYYADRQMENYMNSMITQVRMTEGFKANYPWAIIGDTIQDPLYYNEAVVHKNEIFGGNFIDYLNSYSRESWIRGYIGYHIPKLTGEVLDIISQDERVKDMPCWPNEGSIKVINDTVIIKLQD